MRVFAVLLDAPSTAGFEDLKARYGEDFHAHSPTVGYVYDPNGITAEIAKRVGIKDEARRTTGVVFALNGWYAGYTAPELWEWFEQCERKKTE